LYFALAGLALVVGALSLLLPSTPSYDPWAWLVWGREIVHLKLQTTGGPSWKPLPVIFTTLFAPFGKAAPDMWLVVARAGAVMSVAMVFKVSVRLTRQLGALLAGDAGERADAGLTALGPALLAGLIAAVGLAFSGGFISDNGLGYSEGVMTALVLIAVDRHLDGAHRQAFAVGFLAALDRPEIWLFWGPYGLWLWWKDPEARKLVAALFVLIPILWFLPEYWGSGHFLRGVNRAQHPRSNSPAFAKCPFCTELADHAWPTVLLRIKIFTALAVAAAGVLLWRGHRARGGWTLSTLRERAQAGVVIAGVLGAAWWVVVAIMTQVGFSGNNRYLVLGAALIEIAGGVGWGWLALELGRALPRYVAPLRSAGQGALNAVRDSIYLGTGSYCDAPMVGRVFRVNVLTRAVSHWDVVPAERGGGGGIWGWGGIAYSSSRQSLLAVTGNAFRGGSNDGDAFREWEPYGEHLVELSLSLHLRAASHPQGLTAPDDLDFVGSPIVLDRPGCGALVSHHGDRRDKQIVQPLRSHSSVHSYPYGLELI